MCLGFLKYFRDEAITAEHSSRWIEEHQVRCSVIECQRRERLKRQRESRFAKDRLSTAPLKLQPQVAVPPYPFGSVPRSLVAIQTIASGGSIR